MREIGGYFELDNFIQNHYYKDMIKLNTARNCLLYIIKARNIQKIYIPYFICDSISNMLIKENVDFEYLHSNLCLKNKLLLNIPFVPFMYPYYCKKGIKIRKYLSNKKIYVPILWPNVLSLDNCMEREYAENILPLPCDQRYDLDDMEYMLNIIDDFEL